MSSVSTAWCFAAVYSVLAAVLFSASNSGAPPKFTLAEVLASYWLAATLVGVITGVLRPRATTAERRVAVALVGAWPAVLGIYALANQLALSELDRGDFMFITVMAVAFAIWGANQKDWGD